jgi:hypothetical protein
MEAESPNMENLVVAKKGKGRRWIVAPLKFRRAKVKPSPVREVAVVGSSLDHPSWSHPATSHLSPLHVSSTGVLSFDRAEHRLLRCESTKRHISRCAR